MKKSPLLIIALAVVALGGFFTYRYISVNKQLAKEPVKPKRRPYKLDVGDAEKISEQDFKKGV